MRQEEELKIWIELNYKKNPQLKDFFSSRKYYVRGTVCKNFKVRYDVNPGKYVSLLMVHEAKRLMKTTRLSLQQISKSIGLTSPDGLYRLFITITGNYPKKYLREFSEIKCKHCSKNFWRRFSQRIKRINGTFCSTKCWNEYRKTQAHGLVHVRNLQMVSRTL